MAPDTSGYGFDLASVPARFSKDLATLETTETIYRNLDFGKGSSQFTKIKLLPVEHFHFVDAIRGMVNFKRHYLERRKAGENHAAAILAAASQISDPSAKARIAEVLQKASDSEVMDAAAELFMPGELVLLLEGNAALNRYVVLPEWGELEEVSVLMQIVNCFPQTASLLRDRRKGKQDFLIHDEYDMQDLIYSQSKALFPDCHKEEPTPKVAGTYKLIDVVFPSIKTVLEMKLVRDPGHAKSVADELKIDVESYYAHPSCATLVALVYDPGGYIKEKDAFERELSGTRRIKDREFEFRVIVTR